MPGFVFVGIAFGWVLHVDIEPDRLECERVARRARHARLAAKVLSDLPLKRQAEVHVGD